MRDARDSDILDRINAECSRKRAKLNKEYSALLSSGNGIDMNERRNRLWAWFDRATKYRLIPKIYFVFMFLTALIFAVCIISIYKCWEIFGSYERIIFFVSALTLVLELMFSASFISGRVPRAYDEELNAMADPRFSAVPGNVFYTGDEDV